MEMTISYFITPSIRINNIGLFTGEKNRGQFSKNKLHRSIDLPKAWEMENT